MTCRVEHRIHRHQSSIEMTWNMLCIALNAHIQSRRSYLQSSFLRCIHILPTPYLTLPAHQYPQQSPILFLARLLNPLLASIHGTFALCFLRHLFVRLRICQQKNHQPLDPWSRVLLVVPYRPSASPCMQHHPRLAPSSLSWAPSKVWLCRLC